jgi:uncharacterized SAM-binding protein YcdF (DUF218 family)
MTSDKRTWRLLRRRECLVPTLQGWIALLLIGAGLIVLAVRGAYPFLAVNDPVHSGVLVVEGWVPDYAFEQTIAEFRRDHYSKLFVTGVPLESGAPLSEYKTFAELGAATLVRLGFDTNAVQAVPSAHVRVDRTYTCAVTLKSWFRQHGIAETNVNVITMGAHSRRTRLLFSKAFGKEYRVGVISLESRSYDPKDWWKSSDGVRTVIGEAIGYCYARLFFRPPTQPEQKTE